MNNNDNTATFLFFKIWRNLYLKTIILSNIKLTSTINLTVSTIDSKRSYNEITSLKWMITHNKYSMIIDKIKSNNYIYINKKSIRKLIKHCENFEIYQILFENKRNQLERLDLIETSIKLDSLFALKSFIKLYGGSGGNGGKVPINNRGQYTSLLEIALSFSSLKVAEYLLTNENYCWYNESTLLHSAISQNKNYYDESYNSCNDSSDNSKSNNKKKRFKRLKSDQIQEYILIINGKLENEKQTDAKIIYESINLNLKKQLLLLTEQQPQPQQPYNSNDSLKFIKDKLNIQLDGQFIKRCKNLSGIDKLFSNDQIDIIKVIDYMVGSANGNGELFGIDQDFIAFSQNYNVLYLTNYKQHVNYIKYAILRISTNRGKQVYESSITQLKSNRNNGIKTLLDNFSSILPMFYYYWVDYHFYENDFPAILQIIKELTFQTVNQLWLLVMYNCSVTGFQFYNELIIRFKTATTSNLFSNNLVEWKIESIYKNYIKGSNFNLSNTSYQQVESFIQLCFDLDIHTVHIPWSFIFKSIYENYPANYLTQLFIKYPIFKKKFGKWLNNHLLTLKVLPFKISSDGEIDYEKATIFFNQLNENSFYRIKLFETSCDQAVSITDGNLKLSNYTIKQKVGILNYMVLNNSQFIESTIYSTKSQQFGLFLTFLFGTIITYQDAIEIYSTADLISIGRIIKSNLKGGDPEFENLTLENCLFDQLLYNSISNFLNNQHSDGNSMMVDILMIVNDKENHYFIHDQLLAMDVISVDDKIGFIKFMYTSKLLSNFGCSLSFLLIKLLVSIINDTHHYIDIKFEKQIIKLVEIMNKSSTFSSSTIDKLYDLSLNKRMFRLFKFLMDLSNIQDYIYDEINEDTKKNIEIVYKIQTNYNNILKEIKLEYINSLSGAVVSNDERNGLKCLASSFINDGNVEPLINSIKSFTSTNTNNIIFQNAINRHSYLTLMVRLSTKYCKFEDWFTIYQIMPINDLKWVFKYNRIDILNYFIDKLQNDQDIKEKYIYYSDLLKSAFKKGYTQITNWLLNEKSFIFLPSSSSSNTKNNIGIQKIFEHSLYNDQIEIANLISSTYKHYSFTFKFSNIVSRGYINVLIYLTNNNFILEDGFTFSFLACKSCDPKFIKKLFFFIQKNHQKSINFIYQNRVINFKDTFKK